MAKKKVIKQDPEQLKKENLQRELEKFLKSEIHLYRNPTRKFEVGENVLNGNHDNTKIIEVIENGEGYIIECYGTKLEYGKPVEYSGVFQVRSWTELYKKGSFSGDSKFRTDEKFDIRYYNSTMDSLLFKLYDKINFEPDYQRDLVWSEEDKISLLDSIFNNIEIGKFSFIRLDYNKKGFDFDKGYFYEILDGKQRLTTIKDFYEDRFRYRGFLYSELSLQDRYYFERFPVVIGEIDEPKDRKDIYKYFIRLNTGGKVIDPEHIEKIKKMIE